MISIRIWVYWQDRWSNRDYGKNISEGWLL